MNSFKTYLLLIFLLICFSCTSKNSSVNSFDINKCKKDSLLNTNYYYPNIKLGTKESELIKILGKPIDKNNIEGMGLYLYDKCSFGFNIFYQDINSDEIISSFHYSISISFDEIIKEFGNEYKLYSFIEYETFLLNYKIDNLTFSFWPDEYNKKTIDKLTSDIDYLMEHDKYMVFIKDIIRTVKFGLLSIYIDKN